MNNFTNPELVWSGFEHPSPGCFMILRGKAILLNSSNPTNRFYVFLAESPSSSEPHHLLSAVRKLPVPWHEPALLQISPQRSPPAYAAHQRIWDLVPVHWKRNRHSTKKPHNKAKLMLARFRTKFILFILFLLARSLAAMSSIFRQPGFDFRASKRHCMDLNGDNSESAVEYYTQEHGRYGRGTGLISELEGKNRSLAPESDRFRPNYLHLELTVNSKELFWPQKSGHNGDPKIEPIFGSTCNVFWPLGGGLFWLSLLGPSWPCLEF